VDCEPDIEYGEDISLTVTFPPSVRDIASVMWQKNGKTIDIIKPKYEGTSSNGTNPHLEIRQYSPEDDGEYSFLYTRASTNKLFESSKSRVPPDTKQGILK
jgi:hypothetical protein